MTEPPENALMNLLARLKRCSSLTMRVTAPMGRLAAALPLLGLLAALNPRPAEAHPATQALDDLQGKKAQLSVIQNKFFLKANRFEITPALGYIPNNDLVSVPVAGMFLAYHFSESFAAEGSLLYGSDLQLNGLKGLAKTLLQIGRDAPGFQQPIDRPSLAGVFDARFAPVYGKINLIGEGVINFDFYGTAGLGLIVVQHEEATNDSTGNPQLNAGTPPQTANLAINLGVGFDFFLTQSIALKLDARSLLYVGLEPNYGNLDAQGQPVALGNRLYNAFITTGGVAIFIPRMKPRLTNF